MVVFLHFTLKNDDCVAAVNNFFDQANRFLLHVGKVFDERFSPSANSFDFQRFRPVQQSNADDNADLAWRTHVIQQAVEP